MNIKTIAASAFMLFALSCANNTEDKATVVTEDAAVTSTVGQSGVVDNDSQKNVVQVAVSSPDHTTLVAAVKAGGLVDALSNAGPFTVFAPTNAAFDKLPKGTVEGLLKEEKKDDLINILQYHVSLGVYKIEALTDGLVLGQVNGDNATIHIKDGKTYINDAQIIASVPAANGIVHVIDGVVLHPTK
ncbi:MAG: fasciclin domain-containing protein [Ferruginibacter sp.]